MTTVAVDFSGAGKFKMHVRDAMHDGLAAAGEFLVGAIKRALDGPRTPKVQTGRLRNSIVRTTPKNLETRVGTNVKYAIVHERGGTISGVSKKLTVPLNSEAERLRRQHDTLRTVEGLFLIKPTDGGHPILARKKRTAGEDALQPMFLLTPMVRIPARPFIGPSLEKNRVNLQRVFVRGSSQSLSRRVVRSGPASSGS